MATHDMDHQDTDNQDTDNQDTDNQDAGHQSEEWKRARKRVTDRRDFGAHLVAFAVVNGFLVLVWAVTGGGYFWPAWLLGLWGMGLVLHGWDVFFRRPVTDADVEAELRRRRP